MKKLLEIVLLGLLMSACAYEPLPGPMKVFNDKETKINRAKYNYQAWWYIGKKGINKKGMGYGYTRKEAKENAKKLCYIELDKLQKQGVYGKCGVGGACTTDGYQCDSSIAWSKKKAEERRKQTPEYQLAVIKETCMKFGYKEGSEKLADCMKDIYLKQTASTNTNRSIDPSVWDDILGVSQGMLGGKSSSSSSSSSRTCFKINERVSGTNKICSYNCMGSEVTRNIRSTKICPMSIKQ